MPLLNSFHRTLVAITFYSERRLTRNYKLKDRTKHDIGYKALLHGDGLYLTGKYNDGHSSKDFTYCITELLNLTDREEIKTLKKLFSTPSDEIKTFLSSNGYNTKNIPKNYQNYLSKDIPLALPISETTHFQQVTATTTDINSNKNSITRKSCDSYYNLV